MKKILLIGDMVGYGRVALTPMISILSHMNLQVSTLPTAIISNTFDYGLVQISDMTEYMKKTVEVWKRLNFSFDVIVTGFINRMEQVAIIHQLIQSQPKKPMIISDPIMGDDGSLYHGLPQEMPSYVNELIRISDVVIPNRTELSLLTGESYTEDYSEQSLEAQIQKINRGGTASVVTTSAFLNGESYIYTYDAEEKDFYRVPYQHIPVKFAGTGDIFTAILAGYLANGHKLHASLPKVTKTLSRILQEEKNTAVTEIRDVAIERHLNLL